jgi:hypothetical protein
MKTSNYQISVKRPMDLTREEKRALVKRGYKLPLSARIGRGPLFVCDKVG